MVNNRRKRPSQKRVRNNTSPRHLKRMITRATHGVRINPPPEPPEFTAGPFWAVTVPVVIEKDTVFKCPDLHTYLLQAIGLTSFKQVDPKTGAVGSAVQFKFKVLSVRVWGMNRQPIQLAIAETLDGNRWFKEMNDYGDVIHFSRLGWKYGDASTCVVYDSGADVQLFTVGGTLNSTNKALVYIQMLFRIPDAPGPSMVTSMLKEIDGFEHMAIH